MILMIFKRAFQIDLGCGYNDILTLSRRRPLSYRNQSIDLQSKSMDWFLYDNDLRLERVKHASHKNE